MHANSKGVGNAGLILHWEDPLEKEMKTHFSILVWKISWTEDPGKLQSVGHKESDTSEHAHTILS